DTSGKSAAYWQHRSNHRARAADSVAGFFISMQQLVASVSICRTLFPTFSIKFDTSGKSHCHHKSPGTRIRRTFSFRSPSRVRTDPSATRGPLFARPVAAKVLKSAPHPIHRTERVVLVTAENVQLAAIDEFTLCSRARAAIITNDRLLALVRRV